MQLKPGWRADVEANAFARGRERIDLKATISTNATLQPHIVELHGKSDRSLSSAERELARYVQVRVGADQKLLTIARQLAKLDAIEQVSVSPEVSLPGV